MKIKFHCLFEQSGTFKNVLKSFGFVALDYDIVKTAETDINVNLFREIENEYKNISLGQKNKTIFTDMTPENDFVIAFFPCTYFCESNQLVFKCCYGNGRHELDLKNAKAIIARDKQRANFYETFVKFCFILKTLKIRSIIENPARESYLNSFSPVPVAYLEKDRSLFGDNFVKPTNYFALNFQMRENFQMFYDKVEHTKSIRNTHGFERNLITPQYATNFYKRFLMDKLPDK